MASYLKKKSSKSRRRLKKPPAKPMKHSAKMLKEPKTVEELDHMAESAFGDDPIP